MAALKSFQLIYSTTSLYKGIVFATTHLNPIAELPDIEKELAKNEMECEILFDLLLSNGNSSNRFISAYFDGIKFQSNSFKIVTKLPSDFKKVAKAFYSKSKTQQLAVC